MTITAPVAILLFTRSAEEEARHKRFVSHSLPARNVSVAAQLIHHAQATATLVGIDVVCVDSSQQTGATFGERLTGAMQRVFERGYEHLLVIGNDCPQLDTPLLQRALAALHHGKAVVGPATDGGVYLLGVARAQFEQAIWQKFPWQTPHLGAALQRQLSLQEPALDLVLLPALADIDNEQDLARALRQPLARALRQRLHRLRTASPSRQIRSIAVRRRPIVAAPPHRGPPAS